MKGESRRETVVRDGGLSLYTDGVGGTISSVCEQMRVHVLVECPLTQATKTGSWPQIPDLELSPSPVFSLQNNTGAPDTPNSAHCA